MIVFHDSFGEPWKPPNHASNDPNYYTFPIGLAQKSIHNAIQGDNCVLETAVRKPLCYDTMIQNIILLNHAKMKTSSFNTKSAQNASKW